MGDGDADRLSCLVLTYLCWRYSSSTTFSLSTAPTWVDILLAGRELRPLEATRGTVDRRDNMVDVDRDSKLVWEMWESWIYVHSDERGAATQVPKSWHWSQSFPLGRLHEEASTTYTLSHSSSSKRVSETSSRRVAINLWRRWRGWRILSRKRWRQNSFFKSACVQAPWFEVVDKCLGEWSAHENTILFPLGAG